MVNELRDLMQASVAHPPHEGHDLAAVLEGGRRRVRRRRLAVTGGTALASAAIVGLTTLAWPSADPPDFTAAGVPRPEGPVLRLSDATAAQEGEDYRLLASYTNEDLDADNGQYVDGVTDDGLLLFRDGPRRDQLHPRYALMDPATGAKDWLPELDVGQSALRPLELGEDRLVLLGTEAGGRRPDLVAHTFDRSSREWEATTWPGLPPTNEVPDVALSDGRLYVPVPASTGRPPEGGWPKGPGGEADDADAEGDTHRLWSASLTDPADVRDEGLTVGEVVFTNAWMVWTDSTNGDAGRVHVLGLNTGEQRTFDPRTGERCNLLELGASGDRILMSQYCGTYDDGVRDDRVQVLSTDGDQVTTIQGSGIEGAVAGPNGPATITSYEPGRPGTYVYDLATDRFLRVSDDVSSWTMTSLVQPGQFAWTTPVNDGHGATQHVGELVD